MDFDFFRERKSSLMAALVILAMFSFVALGPIQSCSRTGERGSQFERLRLAGRPVSDATFQRIRDQRERARAAIERLAAMAGDKANLEMLPYMHFSRSFAGNIQQDALTSDFDGIAQLLALDAKAGELGIDATDAEALAWIGEFTSKSLTSQQVKEAFQPPKETKSSRRARAEGMGLAEFAEVMRRELRASRTLDAVAAREGGESVSPLGVFRYRADRAHAEVQLELCRLEAEKFADPKAVPPEPELVPVYDDMKNVPAENPRKLPGLRRPPQAEVAVVTVKPDALAGEVKIDDKRCRDYYDQHPEEFRKALAPPPPPDPLREPPPDPVPPPEAKTDAKPAEKSAPNVPAPSPEAKKAAEPPAKKPAAALAPPAWAALVAVVLPQGDGKATAKPEAPKKAAPNVEPPKPGEAPMPPAKLGVPLQADPPPPPPVDGAGMAKAADPKPADLKPFDEVKEEIRKRLIRIDATNLAFDRLEKALKTDLKDYAGQVAEARILHKRNHAEDDPEGLKFVPPAMTNPLSELARAVKGEHLPATMVDPAKARALPMIGAELGFENRVFPDPSGTYPPDSFHGDVLRGGGDRDGYVFLFWVGKTLPGSSPPLAEARDQVVKEWRKQDGAKKALEEAVKLADKAKAAPSLAEALKGTAYTPFRPKAFTRALAIPDPVRTVRLVNAATLEGVPDVDEAFLEAAYDLEVGEVKALRGQAEAKDGNAFVVRCVERKPAPLPEFARFYMLYRQQSQVPEERARMALRAKAEALQRVVSEYAVASPRAAGSAAPSPGDDGGDP